MRNPYFQIVAALALVCCAKSGDPAVATVAGETLHASSLQRRLAAKGADPHRELEALVRDALLAQEARRRGLDQSAAVREAARRAMREALLDDELSRQPAIAEAEVPGYFLSHAAEFSTPERLRILHLLVPASSVDARARAERVLRDVAGQERRGERAAFQAAAMKDSADEATRAQGGDLGLLNRSELARAIGPQAAEAAFALRQPGDQAGPIETPRGFELIELVTRAPARSRELAEVAELIRGRLLQERKSRVLEELAARLRRDAEVHVDEAEVGRLSKAPP